MVKVKCIRCGLELEEAGALLLTPPLDKENICIKIYKLHLCNGCFCIVLDSILLEMESIFFAKSIIKIGKRSLKARKKLIKEILSIWFKKKSTKNETKKPAK